METFDAIAQRRSIRKFTDKKIPPAVMEKILQAGMLAPSAKNRQPWRFIVITEKEKPAMLAAMQAGLAREKGQDGLFPDSVKYLAGAEYTLAVMAQAPITVFVFNTEAGPLRDGVGITEQLFDIANVQSVGAAIQNMLLAATDQGVGSLWICDVFFAYPEIVQWLNESNRMIAAVSFGYTEENPAPRPRKAMENIVVWR